MTRLPTSQATIGPFFPRSFFGIGDNDLTRISAEAAPTMLGERILLRGTVAREGGAPLVNGILEAWQADAGGRFRHPEDPQAHLADPDFLGWGRAFTDAGGRYIFITVLPGGYLDRAPHVNLTVMGAGLMRRVMTTVFFPDHAVAHATDPVLNAVPAPCRPRLVARAEGVHDGLRCFGFDLRLRGEASEETPFFED